MSIKNPRYCYSFFDLETPVKDPVFNISPAVRVRQIHSNKCIHVDCPFENDEWVEGDGLVTTQLNLPIGVITADCVPVLLYGEREGGVPVIGAAHAGWQGALCGILDNTVQVMNCDLSSIQAMIGPCIARQSYEVSKGFEEPFLKGNPEAEHFFTSKNADKLLFDLAGYCAFRLNVCGVAKIHIHGDDTLTNPNYHSHRGGAGKGQRNLSAIMIIG